MRYDLIACDSLKGLKAGLYPVLGGYEGLLPASRTAKILIKPNLNSNMSALTGNTTDLRLLAAVIQFLADRGYRAVTIGEGTNSGFYRSRISVIERLAVDRLARHFGVRVVDLNYAEPVPIVLEGGVQAAIARDVAEAELLVNLPKLKTHAEAGMSVCLKNLIGCLVGQDNKKKVHRSLAANILALNRHVRPQLHVVDALISMEGLGPTRGTPIRTDTVLVGDDPFLLDLLCARLAGFELRDVAALAEAERRGTIDERHHRLVRDCRLERTFTFAAPQPGLLARLVHHPGRQRYFLAVRNTPLVSRLCSSRLGGRLLVGTGLRQDVFLEEEMACESLRVDAQRCTGCGRCARYCPIGLDPAAALAEQAGGRCIRCLYCYSVCPERAIVFAGRPGFFAEQLRQYDDIIRRMA